MNLVLRIITGISLVILIFFGFYYSSPLSRLMDKNEVLEVDSRFSGGDVRSSFFDPFADDYGEGGLKYPVHEKWNVEGTLDILKYEIYEPLVDGAWSAEGHFWQLKVTMAEKSPDLFQPVIRIYIDLDGKRSGSVETLNPRGEMLCFDPGHPWDIVVTMEGRTGKAWWRESGKSEDHELTLYQVDNAALMVRLPLEGPIEKVLDGRDTWHYLICGAFDPLGTFLPVQEKRSSRSGWGAESRYTPRVYDYLAPTPKDQKTVLSSYDETSRKFACLFPVHDFSGQLLESEKDPEDEETDFGESTVYDIDPNLLENPDLSPGERAGILFQMGRIGEAEKILEPVFANTEDPEVMAYWGSIVAMRGGEASTPLEAMELVYEGIDWLNKAVDISEVGSIGWITALNARAAVSVSVPNEVFGYASQGADDYETLGDYYYRNESNSDEARRYYQMASDAWQIAGKKEKAEITLLKGKSL